MEGFFILLALLVVGCILCGPIALVWVISLSNKIDALRRTSGFSEKPAEPTRFEDVEAVDGPLKEIREEFDLQPEVPAKPAEEGKIESALWPPPLPPQEARRDAAEENATEDILAGIKSTLAVEQGPGIEKASQLLEQRIGTKWILIAGVITTFFGVAFFLRYAYLRFSISDLAKVIIVAVCGFVALAVGEITRRRGYEIVAKGVTALGFAILYAAIFAAQQFYGLLGSTAAFLLAAAVTAAAMAYALVLNEIIIAFLSLLGGYLTPAIVSTGRNLPTPLFVYVTLLSVGAMLCACYRKWRAVDVLAFIGTFALYAGWFEKFYRPAVKAAAQAPEQMAIALAWLGVFFAIYLVMPALYELAKRVKAKKEDVLLILANAAVVFYYAWTILFDNYRTSLALCAVGLCATHLAMMLVVTKRCPDDADLRQVLLAIGFFFLTIAVPIYFKMYVITIAWAAQGAILAVIGLRYRSILTQIAAGAALILSCGNLLLRLPMHTEAFSFVLNKAFGTWCFVAALVFVCHLLYRRACESAEDPYGVVAQILYGAAVILSFAAATMEWYCHCKYNLAKADELHYISRGQMIIFAMAILICSMRPLCPRGELANSLSIIVMAGGAVFGGFALTKLHTAGFIVFANLDFAPILIFIAAMVACHIRYRFAAGPEQDLAGVMSQVVYGVLGLLLSAAIAAEWYWHCVHNLHTPGFSEVLIRGLVIIVSAAILLFVVRPVSPRGSVSKVLAAILAGAGVVFTVIAFPQARNKAYVIFANINFTTALLFVAALFASAWLLNRISQEHRYNRNLAIAFALSAVFVLWVLLNEEIYLYWCCRNRFYRPLDNWQFLAQMYIRYMALGLFALLLAKVFVWDTRRIESVYRIAAFLAAGVTLVTMSYLYQFLKKKGFFEATVLQKNPDK
jgi:uncharacterized membrane protein